MGNTFTSVCVAQELIVFYHIFIKLKDVTTSAAFMVGVEGDMLCHLSVSITGV